MTMNDPIQLFQGLQIYWESSNWIAVIMTPYSKCFSEYNGDTQPIPGKGVSGMENGVMKGNGVGSGSHLRQEGFWQGEQWAASRRSISKTWQSLSLRSCSLWEAVGMVTKLMDSGVKLCLDLALTLDNMKFSNYLFVCLSFPICVKVGFRPIPTLWRYSEIICIDIGRCLEERTLRVLLLVC